MIDRHKNRNHTQQENCNIVTQLIQRIKQLIMRFFRINTVDNNSKIKKSQVRTDAKATSPSDQIPPISKWEHKPLFFEADSSVVVLQKNFSHKLSCPIGTPFEFESDLFKGQAMVRIRGLQNSTDLISDNKYFQGRKRKNQIIIQGKFKEEIKCIDVITGTEFKEGFSTQPPMFLHNLVLKFLRRISPSLEMSLYGDKPKVLACIGEASQVICVDEDGEQPDIRSVTGMKEKGFADSPAKRKKLFSSLHERSRNISSSQPLVYDTNKVYTFEMYDDLVDYTTYNIQLAPFLSFDMVSKLDKQPFQVMARTKTDKKYLWLFNIRHMRQCADK